MMIYVIGFVITFIYCGILSTKKSEMGYTNIILCSGLWFFFWILVAVNEVLYYITGKELYDHLYGPKESKYRLK